MNLTEFREAIACGILARADTVTISLSVKTGINLFALVDAVDTAIGSKDCGDAKLCDLQKARAALEE